MAFEKVLIIEDDRMIRGLQEEIFRRRNFTVTLAESLNEAEAAIARESFDLVMLDIRLPDGDGHHFLERLAALPERPLVVIVTGHGTVESAVACMRAGAFDYLLKPFTASQIDVILKRAQTFRQLVKVNRLLSDQMPDGESAFVGRSPVILRLRQLIERVAPTDATVFITGENGTGKEMVAHELYRRSSRKQNPFIKVNCAAVSEALIESEFFGHERGAFTGATDRREGRFELAHQGTLLLDEVSEIPANLQAKLLRVLQEREFERVGGNRTIKVNVRILATSNRDLVSYVEQGSFRQDLYYRLNVFPVHVPPLRDRPEDIAPLAEHFLARFSRKLGIKVAGFSASALDALANYRWPGNVRELQNTIERAVILTEKGRPVTSAVLGLPVSGKFKGSGEALLNSVAPFDFNAEPPLEEVAASAAPSEATGADFRAEEGAPAVSESVAVTAANGTVLSLAELEKQAIRKALEQTGGNRTKAAEALGISIRTLRNKLQEYREAGDPIAEADE
jgi:DNA-binding NtrC family response regulator